MTLTSTPRRRWLQRGSPPRAASTCCSACGRRCCAAPRVALAVGGDVYIAVPRAPVITFVRESLRTAIQDRAQMTPAAGRPQAACWSRSVTPRSAARTCRCGSRSRCRRPSRACPPRRCGARTARSHWHFAAPRIRFIPDSLTYSVPLFLKRQCDRTPRAQVAFDGFCGHEV
jgi:hypothetical protein